MNKKYICILLNHNFKNYLPTIKTTIAHDPERSMPFSEGAY